MPAQLLLGEAPGRLIDVSRRAGAPWQVPRLGRGLAVGDLDNDGRLDLLIVAEGTPLAYFHNQGPAGHFVTLAARGGRARQPRRGRCPGDAHRRWPPPGRRADRRRQLPVGQRSPAPLRAGRGDSDRVGRGPLALGARRPLRRPGGRYRLPAARGTVRGHYPAGLEALTAGRADDARERFAVVGRTIADCRELIAADPRPTGRFLQSGASS